MVTRFHLTRAVFQLRWWLLAGALACALMWWAVLWPATGVRASLWAHLPGMAPLLVLALGLLWWGYVRRLPTLREAEAQAWQRAMVDSALPTLLLDGNASVVVANRACGHLLGRPSRQLVGVALADLCTDVDLTPITDNSAPRVLEWRVQTAQGKGRWLQLWLSPVQDVSGIAWLGHFIDIDAQKQVASLQSETLASLHARSSQLRQALVHQEAHDALTGLLNRAAFETMLQPACRQAQRTGVSHAVIFIDLDRFNLVNDVAGHGAGDTLLQQVAERLREAAGPRDSVARLGGDEFGVLLYERTLDEAREWAEALLVQLTGAPFVWQGRKFDVSASAGVAAIDPGCHDVASVMTQADVACYAAKHSGRNRVSVYHEEEGEARRHHREVMMVSDLRTILDTDHCVLYAQRILPSTGGDEQRYEMLVRLIDADGQELPPMAVIPAAERYDAMAVVDRWVFEHCLLELGDRLAGHPEVVLHVNVSANSLNDPTFVDRVQALLQQSPLAAAQVVFEITETALVENLEAAARAIARLRLLGCGVALDDFGTGLSSFNYLRAFKVDFVKIDGSFIGRMSHSEVDRHIVQAIYDVASAVGARTIAEGVEDSVTLEIVRRMGVDYVQGFGLHRPEPWSRLLTLLSELR